MKFLFLILSLLSPLYLEASPRLRVLIVADIVSRDIREGTSRDYRRIQESVKNIAEALHVPLSQSTLVEKNYTPDKIKNWIRAIRKEDIVLFYYSGHGFRPKKKSIPWPSLACKTVVRKKSHFISGKEIISSVKKRHPRFSLILFDCCNDPLHAKSPTEITSQFLIPDGIPLPGLATLFLHTRGSVAISAASPGQPALALIGGKTIGSLFSMSFIRSLFEEGQYSDTSWHSVIERALPAIRSGSSERQRPFYKIDTKIFE